MQNHFPIDFADRYPLKILIAEDVYSNERAITCMLNRLGYTTESVMCGEDALVALSNSVYDVILMDIKMPGMDGLTATREIRATGVRDTSGERPIYIVGVSALAFDHDRELAFAAGMDAYVTKPYSISQIKESLICCFTRFSSITSDRWQGRVGQSV